jgi:hypothetical protein
MGMPSGPGDGLDSNHKCEIRAKVSEPPGDMTERQGQNIVSVPPV